MSRKGLGMTAIVDAQRRVLGIYTDGDLRRTLDQPVDISALRMREVMTANPKTIGSARAGCRSRAPDGNRHASPQLLVVDEDERADRRAECARPVSRRRDVTVDGYPRRTRQ